MNKKILGLLALSMIGSQPMQALTRKQVVGRAAVLGLAAGAGTYWACLPTDISWLWPLERTGEGEVDDFVCGQGYVFNPPATISTIGGVAALAGTSSFFAWIFSYWTAQSRHRWAQKQFDLLESCPLYSARMNDTNIASLLQDAGCEYRDLPLITAFERLRSHDRMLRHIEEQLIKAIEDAGRHSELGRKLRKLLKRAAHGLDRVRANETFIKSHDKAAWLEQWKVYQKRKLERERMRQQMLLTSQPHFHGHYVYHR